MPAVLNLAADDLRSFSLPHTVRLVGERQYLLGAGSLIVATDLRLRVGVQETPEPFSLQFLGMQQADDLAGKWERALRLEALAEEAALEGLAVTVDFGELGQAVPPAALTASPTLATALVAAVLAHRTDGLSITDVELAGRAAAALCAVRGGGERDADRYYGEALMSIVGGAGYVEPGAERINVQQLLPLDSFILALAPAAAAGGVVEADRRLRQVLAKASGSGADILGAGDAGMEALFSLGNLLDEGETSMLYGLLRVRQMMDGFLEHLGEPFVDNDRLAEMCDEESAILADYFAFPADLYGKIRSRAGESGALGCKFTWAFGGCPAAVIIAPGRRDAVLSALLKRFPEAAFWPFNMQVAGLQRLDDD